MAKEVTINVDSDLKGKPILAQDTGERLGEVTDAIIHPTEGRLLGIALKTPDGERRLLTVQEIRIGEDAVMAAPGARPHTVDDAEGFRDGVAALDEIIGASVITESGSVIGHVGAVYLSMDHTLTAYRVAESTLQRWFGGGFFVAGDVPHAYASDRPRLIVPADIEERFGAASVKEALSKKKKAGTD